MSLAKKIILAVVGVILVAVTGVCAYGVMIYSDANKMVDDVYSPVSRANQQDNRTVAISATEPFSVLLMGVDTGYENGDQKRVEGVDVGRSDTMMVVTINPKENKSTVLSLSRDTLTNIVGYGTMDKLNHAYAYGGPEMAIDTVENLLDIPIDHYISINMQGLEALIDAVGGINVNNPTEFTLDGVKVPSGKNVHLNGSEGLQYARMRYEDPEGDVGRQRRQREVVEKIMNKIISIDGLTRYKKILNAVKENMKTDLSWKDMQDIQAGYLSSFKTIEQIQLKVEGTVINETSYELMYQDDLLEIQNTLRKQLGLAENTELTYGDEYSDGYATYQFADGYGTGTYESSTYSDSQYSDDSQYYDAGQDTGQYGYSDGTAYDQGYVDPGYQEGYNY